MKTFIGRESNFGVKFTKKEGKIFFSQNLFKSKLESLVRIHVISNRKQTKSEKPLTSVVLLTMSALSLENEQNKYPETYFF